jgi:hypothetical protein
LEAGAAVQNGGVESLVTAFIAEPVVCEEIETNQKEKH